MCGRIVAGSLLLAALACSNAIGPGDLRGVWGVEGAQLTVGSTEATLQTSCWLGRFPVPSDFGDDGSFEIQGTRTSQGGAPPVEPPQPRPVTFAGRIYHDLLTLTVTEQSLDFFVLRRGVKVDIPGCP